MQKVLIGDTHSEQGGFVLLQEYGKPEWTADDYLIVCGISAISLQMTKERTLFFDELAKKPYTICFIDGNHENFQAIYCYSTEV